MRRVPLCGVAVVAGVVPLNTPAQGDGREKAVVPADTFCLLDLTGASHALGFMHGDKEAGPFTLEVESVKVVRAAKSPAPHDSMRR